MSHRALSDLIADELFLAGERVPSGIYREIGTGREIELAAEDVLPASLDGRIAAYTCIRFTWKQIQAKTPQSAIAQPST